MAFVDPRGLPITDIGPTLVTLCACTLADYAATGTTTPVVDDIVTFSTTGNWYVKRAADNVASKLGRVKKIELAPSGTALGFITVEWLDVVRFVECTVANLANVTLGNSLIKQGDTATANDFDAGSTTGNLICVAKSAATGAGTALAAVVAA